MAVSRARVLSRLDAGGCCAIAATLLCALADRCRRNDARCEVDDGDWRNVDELTECASGGALVSDAAVDASDVIDNRRDDDRGARPFGGTSDVGDPPTVGR